jgi:hypothetical protein
MARTKTTCGKTTIEYDERCGYVCNCIPGRPCDWTVTCPDGRGGWIKTTGTGLVVHPPSGHPSVTVAGTLEAFATSLSAIWKRRVTVPPELRRKRVRRRRISGSPEKIAEVLGLKLGRPR